MILNFKSDGAFIASTSPNIGVPTSAALNVLVALLVNTQAWLQYQD